VSSEPGEVIKPDSWKMISDEGMPVHGRPFEKGNLYVRFGVVFPDRLSPVEMAEISKVCMHLAQPSTPTSSAALGGRGLCLGEPPPLATRCLSYLCTGRP
jgi:DnaJ-class molecular chaperone